jgi:hypothetical protein
MKSYENPWTCIEFQKNYVEFRGCFFSMKFLRHSIILKKIFRAKDYILKILFLFNKLESDKKYIC